MGALDNGHRRHRARWRDGIAGRAAGDRAAQFHWAAELVESLQLQEGHAGLIIGKGKGLGRVDQCEVAGMICVVDRLRERALIVGVSKVDDPQLIGAAQELGSQERKGGG